LFKFEPIEGCCCHAGPVGELTVHFYSNFAPAGIGEPNLFLVDKYAKYSDWGMITGVFPGLPCGPIKEEGKNWGEIKSDYR
jgi:hypothetical protein